VCVSRPASSLEASVCTLARGFFPGVDIFLLESVKFPIAVCDVEFQLTF
jgi:hypothetical protein